MGIERHLRLNFSHFEYIVKNVTQVQEVGGFAGSLRSKVLPMSHSMLRKCTDGMRRAMN